MNCTATLYRYFISPVGTPMPEKFNDKETRKNVVHIKIFQPALNVAQIKKVCNKVLSRGICLKSTFLSELVSSQLRHCSKKIDEHFVVKYRCFSDNFINA